MAGTSIARSATVLRFVLVLSLFISSLPTAAATWGSRGIAQSFAVQGDRVYVADGRGVTVYDVGTPAAIRQVDVESGDVESHDVALSGTDLLVLATSGGIEWFSIAADGSLTRQGARNDVAVSDVAASATRVAAAEGERITLFLREGHGLSRLRHIQTSDVVRDLVFAGDFLYASFDGGGVSVYDGSGVLVNRLLVPAATFARAGDVLWVAAGQAGIYGYDVSDPANPRTIVSRVGDREIHADGVAYANGHLFVRDGNRLVRIYDVRNLANIREVGRLEEWVQVLAGDGNRLYLAGTIFDRENLPFATGVPLRIHDVSNPPVPQFAGEFRDRAGPLSGVFTNGSIAYVSDPPFFRTIDVSKTAAPQEMASIEVADLQDSVRVKNGLAIVYGRGFVNLIDVSDPWAPKLLSTWDALGHPASSAALLRDTYVEANQHSGMHIIDYDDPAGPWQIAGRIWHYHSVAAGDDVVYALQALAIRSLDLRDRWKVVDAWEANYPPSLEIDTVPPNTAFPSHLVSSRHDGLDIWSLEDRFRPRLIASTPLAHPGVFGTSESDVIIAWQGTLWRMDLTGALTDTRLPVTSAMQISGAGEKIVVADRYGLRVYGPDTAPPPPRPEDPPPAQPGKRRAVRGR